MISLIVEHIAVDPIVLCSSPSRLICATLTLFGESGYKYILCSSVISTISLSRNDVTIAQEHANYFYIVAINTSIVRLTPRTIYRRINRAVKREPYPGVTKSDTVSSSINELALALTHLIVCKNVMPIKFRIDSVFYMFALDKYRWASTKVSDSLFDSIFGERKSVDCSSACDNTVCV